MKTEIIDAYTYSIHSETHTYAENIKIFSDTCLAWPDEDKNDNNY